MRPLTANENSRLLFWARVREFAVPPSMIESATARRSVGDWAGACAAARVDVDLNLRAVARTHGRQFAAQVRADLRHLAPDLLRWHFPRIGPDGLLRPGLTVSLARYPPTADSGAVHLVARTPPAWADAGQRISLALWEPSRPRTGAGVHPHPRPDKRDVLGATIAIDEDGFSLRPSPSPRKPKPVRTRRRSYHPTRPNSSREEMALLDDVHYLDLHRPWFGSAS